jgi:DNA-binding CsgD family transcriptional regulator
MHDVPYSQYEALLAAENLDALQRQAQAIVAMLGFNGFLYLSAQKTSKPVTSAELCVLSSHAPAFVQRYQNQHCHQHDPTALHIQQHPYPIAWGQHTFQGIRAKAMYRFARQHGIRSGAVFPVSSAHTGLAHFSYACNQDFKQALPTILAAMPYGQLLATFVHQAAISLLQLPSSAPNHGMTERERTCLYLAAQGLRDNEIAHRLGITPRTVLFHLGNARQKLGADNRAQMMARAITLKVIVL